MIGNRKLKHKRWDDFQGCGIHIELHENPLLGLEVVLGERRTCGLGDNIYLYFLMTFK
jgi:hypothetical protein